MKHIEFKVQISAPKETVWDALVNLDKYKIWAKAFSSDSQFIGDWKQGESITFFDPNLGGTKAIFEELILYKRICARHIAIWNKDGSEDVESEEARKWMGTIESYTLNEEKGKTELIIEIHTHEDYINIFNNSWPKAIKLLKELCETSV